MAAREPDQTLIERALARPISGTAKAGWGFTNRTDFVTLGSGERVVLQRFGEAARRMGELLTAFRQLSAGELAIKDLWADPGRPAVLAHGDFAPVNVLTDGVSLTGLLDFEAVRRADQLFDPAWWAWSVSFSGPGVLDAAWPLFLRGAGLDSDDPGLPARVSALQVLRMLELLVPGSGLDPGIQDIVAGRLRAEVAWQTER